MNEFVFILVRFLFFGVWEGDETRQVERKKGEAEATSKKR
jgi:hypothetical protein